VFNKIGFRPALQLGQRGKEIIASAVVGVEEFEEVL
jgi:hypothetical protein